MKNLKLLVICLLVLALPGCAWLNKLNPLQKSAKDPTQSVQINRVVDQGRLLRGGKLLVVAFNPGENVEATERVDRVSFMVAKGITDVVEGGADQFEMLSANEAKNADLIIEGHITKIKKSSFFKKLFLLGGAKRLSVKGRMVDRKTGKDVMLFSDSFVSKHKDASFEDVGYIVGQHLGEYIISSLN